VPDNVSKKADPWIGDIPQDWNRFRIKDIAEISPGFSDFVPTSNEKCVVVPMEALSEKGEIHASLIQEFQDIQPGLTNFEEGDVLFAKITPCMENGKGAFIDHLPTRYGFGSTEFHVLRPGQKLNGKFLYYFTFNPVYRQYAADNMTGAASQKRVSTKFLAYTPIFLPLFIEQQRIAAYLDKACAAIDGAIRAKRRQLEVLDHLRKSIIHKAVTQGLNDKAVLKDSGVEWLGQVPQSWQRLRIKDIAQFSPGFSGPAPTLNELCAVVPMDSVSSMGRIDVNLIQEYQEVQQGLTNFEKGDVIFAKITPCMENGKGAFVEDIPTRYAFGSTEFHVLRPGRKVGGKFLYYFTVNAVYRDYAAENMTGAAGQKRVSTKFLAYTPILLPSMAEQYKIATYLDRKCSDLDNLWMILEKQISALEQYRKSLIHECVTGKRRITGVDLAKKG
jgi:restriction endonuclease S subunit